MHTSRAMGDETAFMDLPFPALERIWLSLDNPMPGDSGRYTASRHALISTCTAARRFFAPLIQHAKLRLPPLPLSNHGKFLEALSIWRGELEARHRFLHGMAPTLRALDITRNPQSMFFSSSPLNMCLPSLHVIAQHQLSSVTAVTMQHLGALDAKDMCHVLPAVPNLTTLTLRQCSVDCEALRCLTLARSLRSLTLTEVEWTSERSMFNDDVDDTDVSDAAHSMSAATSLTHLDLDLGTCTYLGAVLPVLAGRLTRLQRLVLTHAPNNGSNDVLNLTRLSCLQPLQQLADLRLRSVLSRDATLTEDEAQALVGLTQLRHLALSGVDLTGPVMVLLVQGLSRLRSLHLDMQGSGWSEPGTFPAEGGSAAGNGGAAQGSLRELRCNFLPFVALTSGRLLGLTRLECGEVARGWAFGVEPTGPAYDREQTSLEVQHAVRSMAHCWHLAGLDSKPLTLYIDVGAPPAAAVVAAAVAHLDPSLAELNLINVAVDATLTAQLARSLPHVRVLGSLRATFAGDALLPLLQLRHLLALQLQPRSLTELGASADEQAAGAQPLLMQLSALCLGATRPLNIRVRGWLTPQQGEECRAAAIAEQGHSHVTFEAYE